MMKCDICNKDTKTYIKEHKHSYNIEGKEIKFISLRRFCESCNNLIYDSELDNRALEIALSIRNKILRSDIKGTI